MFGENGRGRRVQEERMCEKEQNKLLEGRAMDFSTGERGKLQRLRVGMRR
jgi:hypothetical protein